MSRLETTAELVKLAQVLGLERHAVGYLATLPPHEIRRLREAAVARMFEEDSTMFRRLAKASRLLPNSLVAFLGEKIFGPLLVARIAGEMPLERAIDIAQRMSPEFLAEVACDLEPEAAKHIIRELPPEIVAKVALILLKRGKFIVMGRFTDYLGEKAIRTVLEAVSDDEALLHIGFFMESKKRLNQIVNLLPDSRLKQMIAHAQAKPEELWPEALSLMSHVDEKTAGRLGDLTAEQDSSVLASLAEIAQQQQLWGDILPVIASMSAGAQGKLLQLPILQREDVMESILQAADADRLWESLLPQIKQMGEAQLQTVADVVTRLPQQAQERLIDAARHAGLWDQLFDIVASLPKPRRASLEKLVAQFAQRDSSLVELLGEQAQKHGLDDLLSVAKSAVDKLKDNAKA